MANETLRLISRARRWLILRQILDDCAWPLALGLGSAALILFIFRFLPLELPAWIPLLLGLGSGLALGLLRARARPVGAMEAADWVDRRLRSKSLMSAALSCVSRGLSGTHDAAIVERSERLAAGAGRLRPSFLPLRRRILLATALAAASFLPFLISSGPRESGSYGESISSLQGTTSSEASAEGQIPDGAREAEAAEQAKELFPNDKRLANLAQRALREGRLQDLRELVERSSKLLDRQIAQSDSPLERHALDLERKRLTLAAEKTLSAAGRPREGGQEAPPAQEKRVEEQFLPFMRKDPDAQRREGELTLEGGTGSDSKGSIAGTGKGSAIERGAIEARATGEKIDLRKGEMPDLSELIEAAQRGAAASRAAAWAGKAQEGPSRREALPLDYQDDVQSYFAELERLARAAAEDGTKGETP